MELPRRRPGYPLLGQEDPSAVPRPVAAWRLRLALLQPVEPELRAALFEGVEELRLQGDALSLASEELALSIFCEEGPAATTHWTLSAPAREVAGVVPTRHRSWSRGEERLSEQTWYLDSLVLRNLGSLRHSIAHQPSERLVVTSSVSAERQAEGLIADTLAYWTGAVGGASVLEVEQQPGEPLTSLWSRLNVCRLLRWEAGLAEPGDPLAGASLFTQLAEMTTG